MKPARPRRLAQPAPWLALALALPLGGCDMLGIDTPAKQAQRREAEGKAIGAACRHTQRSLEDCYASNPKASKAAIFAGWREMDEYMRENDIPPATPAPRPAERAEPHEEIVETAPAPAPAAAGGGGAASPARPAAPATGAGPTAAPTPAGGAARPAPPTGSIVPNLAPAAERPPGR
ncbi:hypothetical protein Tsedi_02145 [Tepidimonas sediminis]|uniref:Uncharacterized protein n=1 Tax=Tepidimonas sediminis TaxID=2588941 RepID=A0A554WJX9_9BURK|nr:hypothetical protein Tsedi_02145 [Tepidimonas sediminis]